MCGAYYAIHTQPKLSPNTRCNKINKSKRIYKTLTQLEWFSHRATLYTVTKSHLTQRVRLHCTQLRSFSNASVASTLSVVAEQVVPNSNDTPKTDPGKKQHLTQTTKLMSNFDVLKIKT